MRFVRGQIGVRPSGTTETTTTQAALNAEKAAREKLAAARRNPSN
jgi:hypothetical protein